MDLLFALAFSFLLLIFSVFRGYFIAYPLCMAMGILVAVLMQRGFALSKLIQMAITGSRAAIPVLSILPLIGAVTAVWIAAGTVPAIVYYGIKLINPDYFIFWAFVLTSLVSLLLGTSFGTVSTIGIALMIVAKGSHLDPHPIAGAIIAGAYVGDSALRFIPSGYRASWMSSSANLIAKITQTDLYANIKNMLVTGFIPLVISSLLYLALSLLYPVQVTETTLLTQISQLFNLNLIVLLPALTILVLALLRVEVKVSMLISIGVGMVIAYFLQHYTISQILYYTIAGFSLSDNSPLRGILVGGGMISMLKLCAIVVVSTAIAGILAGTNALQIVDKYLNKIQHRSDLFLATTVIGIATGAFGCTQTIAIVLTQQLVKNQYTQRGLTNSELAINLENTVVVLSPLIPWNIAGLVPATILMTDAGFIPYAWYLYILTGWSWLQLRKKA